MRLKYVGESVHVRGCPHAGRTPCRRAPEKTCVGISLILKDLTRSAFASMSTVVTMALPAYIFAMSASNRFSCICRVLHQPRPKLKEYGDLLGQKRLKVDSPFRQCGAL